MAKDPFAAFEESTAAFEAFERAMGGNAPAEQMGPPSYLQGSPSYVGTGEAAVRGVGQGITLGHADEVVGGVQAATDALTSGTTDGMYDKYRSYRDQNRGRDQEAAQTSPWAYYGGNVAGGLALPGGGIGKLAAMGAAAGEGYANTDVVEQPGETAGQALIGGAIGGGLAHGGPAAAGATRSILQGPADKLSKASALRSYVGKSPKTYETLEAEHGLDKAGRYARDDLGVGVLEHPGTLEAKAKAGTREVGNRLGETVDAVTKAAPEGYGVSRMEVAQRLRDEVLSGLEKGTPGYKETLTLIKKYEKNLGRQNYEGGPENVQPFDKAVTQRKATDRKASHAGKAKDSSLEAVRRDTARILNESTDTAMEPLLENMSQRPDLYKVQRGDYGVARKVSDASTKNRFNKDQMGGAWDVGSYITRQFGAQAAAVITKAAHRALQADSSVFGMFEEPILAAAANGPMAFQQALNAAIDADPELADRLAAR